MSVQTEATGPIGKTQERIQKAAKGLLVAEEPPSDRCVTTSLERSLQEHPDSRFVRGYVISCCVRNRTKPRVVQATGPWIVESLFTGPPMVR